MSDPLPVHLCVWGRGYIFYNTSNPGLLGRLYLQSKSTSSNYQYWKMFSIIDRQGVVVVLL